MTQFPRWKSYLVLGALLFGLLFFLPNVFGTDPALQLALRNHDAVVEAQRVAVATFLRGKEVQFSDTYVDNGRLMVRFNSVSEQLKARDAVDAGLTDSYVSALAMAPRTPAFLRALGIRPMNLGLDLRGGLYLLYQVDVEGAVRGLLERTEQSFRRTLRDERIQYANVEAGAGAAAAARGNNPVTIRITLRDPSALQKAQAALAKKHTDMTIEIDSSATAPTLVASITPVQIKERQDYAIDQNITTLRNRVNELGVSEPIVQRTGIDRINVQLPGVQNSADVVDILGKTATLEFRLVDPTGNAKEAARIGRPPLGTKLYYYEDPDYPGQPPQPYLLKRDVIVTGDQLVDAKYEVAQQEGPVVAVKLDSRGAQEMFTTTQQNLERPMAVVFIEQVRRTVMRDGKPVKVDVTEEKIISIARIKGVFSSNFQISGMKPAEARTLALLLRAGSLVAPLSLIEERAIGPSRGQENITQGTHALVVGSLLLFAIMAIYYRLFGLIADVILTFNVILLVALLTMLQAALTLPGIAGIVLIVAMAVDANILIYERIREELRNGNSPLASIEAGFNKAFSAIADSNVTALIAGIVLFVFGTGPIKGFAITLCIGIVTTLFTAILGSRALINLIYGRRKRVEHLPI